MWYNISIQLNMFIGRFIDSLTSRKLFFVVGSSHSSFCSVLTTTSLFIDGMWNLNENNDYLAFQCVCMRRQCCCADLSVACVCAVASVAILLWLVGARPLCRHGATPKHISLQLKSLFGLRFVYFKRLQSLTSALAEHSPRQKRSRRIAWSRKCSSDRKWKRAPKCLP